MTDASPWGGSLRVRARRAIARRFTRCMVFAIGKIWFPGEARDSKRPRSRRGGSTHALARRRPSAPSRNAERSSRPPGAMLDWVLVLDDASKGYGRRAHKVSDPDLAWSDVSLFGAVFAAAAFVITAPAARSRPSAAHDDTTRRRHDEIFVSHFDGLCPVGGAALLQRRPSGGVANGGEPLIFGSRGGIDEHAPACRRGQVRSQRRCRRVVVSS